MQNMTVESAWKRLEKLILAKETGYSPLNPPVDASEIDSFESEVGYSLNEEITALLGICNGEVFCIEGGVIFGESLLSLNEIREMQKEYQECLTYETEEGYLYSNLPEPSQDPRLRYGYPFPQLTPFVSNLSDSFFGVDNFPGEQGVKGQVFAYGRDLEATYICDNVVTFLELLEELALSSDIAFIDVSCQGHLMKYPRVMLGTVAIKNFRDLLTRLLLTRQEDDS